MNGSSMIVRGDATALPLADDSVDLVVTSPPYFQLRSYTDGGEHCDGQIGNEDSPAAFVDRLLEVTAECMRVTKPSGSIWVNLGDSYSSNRGSRNVGMNTRLGRPTSADVQARSTPKAPKVRDLPPKTLLGIPWRYALACMDELGLILRAEVIWSKPNGLPESVYDRVRRSHEQWFHFTLAPRYYSAVDEIREPHLTVTRPRPLARGRNASSRHVASADNTGWKERPLEENLVGKLPPSVWTVPVAPLEVPPELGIEHFAAFPPEHPRRIILGWSPLEVCLNCGEGRRPIRDHAPWWKAYKEANGLGDYLAGNYVTGEGYDREQGRARATTAAIIPAGPKTVIVGYECGCSDTSAPSRPGVVLDPFSGTGTTAMVARALGRLGVGVDLSSDYCRLGAWRTADPAQLAKVRGEAFRKPEPQTDGQEALWS